MYKHPIIIIFALLYALHLWLKFSGLEVPLWMSNYLADFLCMPLVLAGAHFLICKIQRRATFHFSIAMVLFAVVYFSVVFEWLLPQFSTRFTSDPLDALMYALGALFFYIVIQPTSVFAKKS